jgi:hypothetical protein
LRILKLFRLQFCARWCYFDWAAGGAHTPNIYLILAINGWRNAILKSTLISTLSIRASYRSWLGATRKFGRSLVQSQIDTRSWRRAALVWSSSLNERENRPPRRRRSWVYLIAARCVYKSIGWKSNRQSGEQHTERRGLRSWFICKCQIKGLCTQPDLLCGYYRVRGWFRAAGRYHRAAYARAYQPKSLLERVKPSAVTY